MTMSRWFRFYDQALNDPKVQMLPADDFKSWVNLLCLASQNDGKLPGVTAIAFALRVTENAAVTVLERLHNAGLIDKCNGGANGWFYAPHGWDKRQYKSDSSAERVKRHRANKCNVTVTPPETETETECSLGKPKGADAPPEVIDPAKLIFDAGLQLLAEASVPERNARSLLGKWRREYGDEALIAALGSAKREGAIDPVSFIEGIFRGTANRTNRQNTPAGKPVDGFTAVLREVAAGGSRPADNGRGMRQIGSMGGDSPPF